MSGAAINIIVAPWFEWRRGMAVSRAMNGASAGGVVIIPLLTVLITATGLAAATATAVASMLAVLVPVSLLVLCAQRADEHEPMSSVAPARQQTVPDSPSETATPFRLATMMCSGKCRRSDRAGRLSDPSVRVPSPTIGTVAGGWAVSLTTFVADPAR